MNATGAANRQAQAASIASPPPRRHNSDVTSTHTKKPSKTQTPYHCTCNAPSSNDSPGDAGMRTEYDVGNLSSRDC